MKLQSAALCLSILSLSACTWVEPTRESSEVTLVKDFNVKSCEKITTVSTTVKHKVAGMTRDEETVTEELVTLAKNRAAELGGDSIVSQGPAVDGTMKFDVYKCAN